MISESKPLATKLGALNKYGILKYCVKTSLINVQFCTKTIRLKN